MNTNPFRILLVEDYMPDYNLILRAFQGIPVELESALSFARARELISRQRFDWIMSEVVLHHNKKETVDGLELWSAARVLRPDTAFWLLTNDPASLALPLLEQKLKAPFLLRKPIDSEALRNSLLSHMGAFSKVA